MLKELPDKILLEILMIIEDNENDVVLLQRLFNKMSKAINLVTKSTAESALDYLNDPTQKLPQLIILDLRLPRMDGMHLIQELRAVPRLKKIPIVLVSVLVEEMISAYNGKLASAYLIKPVYEDDFTGIFDTLGFKI